MQKWEFSAFVKKVIKRKGKKNPTLVYPGLFFLHFFEKCLFEYKFDLRLRKKAKKMYAAISK